MEDLLSSTLPDGSPVTIEMDTHFYFICAVVNEQAAAVVDHKSIEEVQELGVLVVLSS